MGTSWVLQVIKESNRTQWNFDRITYCHTTVREYYCLNYQSFVFGTYKQWAYKTWPRYGIKTLDCNHHPRSFQLGPSWWKWVRNQRRVFILTLDLCRDMSRGSTQRLRLEREKEALRNEERDTDTGKFLCPQPQGAPRLHFPGKSVFVFAQIRFISDADTENQNSPGH